MKSIFKLDERKFAMEIGREVEIYNPYKWLPPYGETSVNFSTKDGNLSVVVEYDGEVGTEKKEFLFSGVCSFYGAGLPGPSILNFTYKVDNTSPLGALVEYPESEAATAWTNHFNDGRKVKHYRIAFLAANSLLVVFALDCALKEAS